VILHSPATCHVVAFVCPGSAPLCVRCNRQPMLHRSRGAQAVSLSRHITLPFRPGAGDPKRVYTIVPRCTQGPRGRPVRHVNAPTGRLAGPTSRVPLKWWGARAAGSTMSESKFRRLRSSDDLRPAFVHHAQPCAPFTRAGRPNSVSMPPLTLRALKLARVPLGSSSLMGPFTGLSVIGCAAPTRSKSASNTP